MQAALEKEAAQFVRQDRARVEAAQLRGERVDQAREHHVQHELVLARVAHDVAARVRLLFGVRVLERGCVLERGNVSVCV